MAAPAQAVRLEISKTLVGSDVVKVGQYLTFTIRITNTGTSAVTTLPLVDEFETTILQPALDRFTPPPTSTIVPFNSERSPRLFSTSAADTEANALRSSR